jgi:hypothetical protein
MLSRISHEGCGAFSTTFHFLAISKLHFKRECSRDFPLLCAMIAQNAYANGGAETSGRERERENGETA